MKLMPQGVTREMIVAEVMPRQINFYVSIVVIISISHHDIY